MILSGSEVKTGHKGLCEECLKYKTIDSKGMCGNCARKFNSNNINTKKRGQLKYRYGLTEPEFFQIKMDQDFRCGLCGKLEADLKSDLIIDHDHKTEKIRGLLCYNCNSGLGHFKDSLEILNKAIEYLEKHNE